MLPTNNSPIPLVGLLSLIALTLLIAEGVARLIVPRVSDVEARHEREWHEAIALSTEDTSGTTVLLLGNSLLRAAVDMAALQDNLPPGFYARRLVMEDTTYLDLYYGLKRLLERGSDPDAAVVMLSAGQLASTSVRGSYSAYFLLNLADVVPAGRRADLSPTAISQLFFARLSAYYARREGIRQFVGSQLLPNYAGFTDVISRRAPAREAPSAAELRLLMQTRMDELGTLCAAHGLSCIFAVPPGLSPSSPELTALLGISETSNIQILYSERSWTAADFQPDRFHMSEGGSREFTPLFAQDLGALLLRPGGELDRGANDVPGQ